MVSPVTIKIIRAQQSEILVKKIRSQISLFSSLKIGNAKKPHDSRAKGSAKTNMHIYFQFRF